MLISFLLITSNALLRRFYILLCSSFRENLPFVVKSQNFKVMRFWACWRAFWHPGACLSTWAGILVLGRAFGHAGGHFSTWARVWARGNFPIVLPEFFPRKSLIFCSKFSIFLVYGAQIVATSFSNTIRNFFNTDITCIQREAEAAASALETERMR